jgi:hypothetical protein
MPSPPERSRARLVAYGFLGALVMLAAIPGYLVLDPSWRPVAVRVACAVIVVIGCIRVVGRVRRSIEGDLPSALDAPPLAPRRPALDEHFLRLRNDLVFSSGSRRYFDAFLWPRLRMIGGADLPAPAERRRMRRRGPSLSALDRLIAEIERRP